MFPLNPERAGNYIRRKIDFYDRKRRLLFSDDHEQKYIYVSHHKCATQYVIGILREVCARLKIPWIKCDWREKIPDRIIHWNKFILIQDYSRDIIELAKVKGKGFHVIRDPRDILVSLYYSHKNSHLVKDRRAAEILRDREKLSQLDKSDGLEFLMDNSSYFLRAMKEIADWDYHNQRFYETRYEIITVNPQAEFENIFNFLDIKIDHESLKTILENNTFDKLKSRWRASFDSSKGDHYRKGKAGDWKNNFPHKIKNLFKECYGELLLKLDYEKDYNW